MICWDKILKSELDIFFVAMNAFVNWLAKNDNKMYLLVFPEVQVFPVWRWHKQKKKKSTRKPS